MLLAWLCFGILISNIILSDQLNPPTRTTTTKCAIENQKIQGFIPSQFFQCIRKDNKLYFEVRYCPNPKTTFYETKQRCLPNIGGGEVRCLISGKRCSHNKLGPMAYLNKFKPNYYIVCLPNAAHICRCYGNAIYDDSIKRCRINSKTTVMRRDDSNGIIPKIICKTSGIHSTVDLQFPHKQKCTLFCSNKKHINKQFELNIICVEKKNLTDENVPKIINITETQENIPAEISEIISQEFLKSTTSYDDLESTTDEETTTEIDITSLPTEETLLNSSSTEDISITWTTVKNGEEEPFSLNYDKTTSEKFSLTSLSTQDGRLQYNTYPTFNDRAVSDPLSVFSTTQTEPPILTTKKIILASLSAEDESVQSDLDKKLTEITASIGETTEQFNGKTRLVSSTTEDGSTHSVTDQNFKEGSANTILLTTGHGRPQSIKDENFTKRTRSSFYLLTDDETTNSASQRISTASSITEGGSKQSDSDHNFKEETTNPSGKVITSISSTTEDGSTKSSADGNIKETSSSSQFFTTEGDIIKSSSEKISLTTLKAEDGIKLSTIDNNVNKRTTSPLTGIITSISLTTEDGSEQSVSDQNFNEETTNPSIEVITSKSSTTQNGSTKLATDENIKETSSRAQFFTTEGDIIKSSSKKITLTTLKAEDGIKLSTIDNNFNEGTTSPLTGIITSISLTTEDSSEQSASDHNFNKETTNPSREVITSISSTTKDGSTQLPSDDNIKETSSSSQFFTTNGDIKSSSEKISLATLKAEDEIKLSTTDNNFNEGTTSPLIRIITSISLTTEDGSEQSASDHNFNEKTTNPSREVITSISSTTQNGSIKLASNKNIKETSSSSQFFTTEGDIIKSSSEKITLTTLKAQDGIKLSTINNNVNEGTTSPLIGIITSISLTTEDSSEQSASDHNFNKETTNPSREVITSISSTTKDGSTQLPSDDNIKEKSQFFTTNGDIIKSSSEKISLTTFKAEDGIKLSTIDNNFNEGTTNPLTGIITSIILTTEDGSEQSAGDHNFNEETTNPSKEVITSISSTTQNGSTKSASNENIKETSSKAQFFTTNGDIIKSSSEKISLTTLKAEDEIKLSTIDNNFNEGTTSPLTRIITSISLTTEDGSEQSASDHNFNKETTNPSREVVTSISSTTQNGSIKLASNENIKETSSSSQFFTTEGDIIKSSSEKITLTTLKAEDGIKLSTIDNNVNEGTTSPLTGTITSISLTTEDGSKQSAGDHNFNEETTNPSIEVITSISSTTKIGTTKSVSAENTKDTSSRPQFFTTEGDIIKSSSEKITLTTLKAEDGIKLSTIDNNVNEGTTSSLTGIITSISLATEDSSEQSASDHNFNKKTTNSSREVITSISSTTKDGSTQLPSDDNIKETPSSSQFFTTNGDIIKSSSKKISLTTLKAEDEIKLSTIDNNVNEGTTSPLTRIITSISLTTEDGSEQSASDHNFNEETTNPSIEVITSKSSTTQNGSTKLATDENIKETSSRAQFFTTEGDIIKSSSKKITLTTLKAEDGIKLSTIDNNFNEGTTSPLTGIITSISLTTEDGSKQTASEHNFNEETTNPSRDVITSIHSTRKVGSTKSTSDENIQETSSREQFFTTEGDIIKSSSEKITLTTLKAEDEIKLSTIDNNFNEKNNNEETKNSLKEIITSISSTIEDKSTKSDTDENIKETSFNSQLFTTEDDIIKISSDKNLLTSLTTEGGIKLSTIDHNFHKNNNEGTTNPPKEIVTSISLTTEDEKRISLTSLTTKDESKLWTIDDNFNEKNKETTRNIITSMIPTTEDEKTKWATDENIKETIDDNFNEKNKETTRNIITSMIPTTEDEKTKWATNENIKEIDDNFNEKNKETTRNIITSMIPTTEDEKTKWATDENIKETIDDNFNEKNKETTRNIITSMIPTTEDEKTKSATDENIKETTTSKQFFTTEGDIISLTSTLISLTSTLTENNLNKRSSNLPVTTTGKETTNPLKETIASILTTEEGKTESITDKNVKESILNTLFAITGDENSKETNSGTVLLTTQDETTNQSSEYLLLGSVTPEGESIQSTTDKNFTETTSKVLFSTTDDHLKETTGDETIFQSFTNILVASITPKGGSLQSTTSADQNLKKNTQFPKTTNERVDFRQTTSVALFPITEYEIINSSSDKNVLASSITEDGSVKFPINQSGIPFSVTDEIITPTSEKIAVEGSSIEAENVQSTGKSFSSFVSTPSTTKQLSTTIEFWKKFNGVVDNGTELQVIEVTTQRDLLPGINEQLIGNQEEFNTKASSTTSELLNSVAEGEISTLQDTSSIKTDSPVLITSHDGITEINYSPPKSDDVTPNFKGNLQSVITESTSTPMTSVSSQIKSTEIETGANALYSSVAEYSTNFAPVTASIGSLSQISSNALKNSFSTGPILGTSKNLQTNIPNQNSKTTATSDLISTPVNATATLKTDDENLSSNSYVTKQFSTTVNKYSQPDNTVEAIELSTIKENLFTVEVRTPISTETAYNDSKEYSTITASIGYSSTEQTTVFDEPAEYNTDDYGTKAFFTKIYRYNETTTSEYSIRDDEVTIRNENNPQKFTTENHFGDLNVQAADSDKNPDDLLQPLFEYEISPITTEFNYWGIDESFTSYPFAPNENLEETEYDQFPQDSDVEMGERCVCSGKTRFRNSCKRYYHCSKIGKFNRFVQSEIMECGYCFQFNAKKGICDFPENVPECSVDDGSYNRICTAEGNYSIPLEQNCRKYYECKRNWRGIIELQVKICQVGRIFSERMQKCVRGCRCRNDQQLSDTCEYRNSIFPDRFDCSKYYYCNNEMEVKTLQCSDPYVFDGERCELKSEVICDPSNVYSYLSDNDDEDCNP